MYVNTKRSELSIEIFLKVIKKSLTNHKQHNIMASVDAHGILAQLGEHLPYKQRVTGSSPVGPICNTNIVAG